MMLFCLVQFKNILDLFNLKTWKDKRLQWNPHDYDNLTEITLPVSKIWVKIISLNQRISKNSEFTVFCKLKKKNFMVILKL
jgi:hypothetical protein